MAHREDLYDDYEDDPRMPRVPAKKAKRVMTEAQKASAMKNLEKARAARGKPKEETRKKTKAPRRDYSESDDSDSDSSKEDFVLSKKKPKSSRRGGSRDELYHKVADLESNVAQMIQLQKKQKRYLKDQGREYRRDPVQQQQPTINVNVPASVPIPVKKAVAVEDPYFEKLRKSVTGF